MKVLVNCDYGGFSVSEEVYKELGIEWDGYGFLENKDLGIESDNEYAYRSDPRLIAAVEKVGIEVAEGGRSNLRIANVPDDAKWIIEEFDGVEHVAEVHRTW